MHSNPNKKYHYFYKITNPNTGEFYYGIHSTNNLHDDYMGSGVRLKKMYKAVGKDKFVKDIIEYFDTREQALDYEQSVVDEAMVSDPLCLNMITGGIGSIDDCSTKGLVTVRDKDGKCFDVSVSDPRYLSGELTFVGQGLVTVRDKNGDCFKTSVSDPRYISGELTIISKGNKGFKDYTNIYKDGMYKVIKRTELQTYLDDGWEVRSKSRGRVSPTKNMIWISKGKLTKIIKPEELQTYLDDGWKNQRTISPVKGKIGVIKNGKNKYVTESELQTYLDDGWTLGMTSRNSKMVTVYDPKHPDKPCISVSVDDPRYTSGQLKLSMMRRFHEGKGGSCKGLKYIHRGTEIKRVKSSQIQSYLDDGWKLGMRCK